MVILRKQKFHIIGKNKWTLNGKKQIGKAVLFCGYSTQGKRYKKLKKK
jgi:hypothetical protein